MLRINAFWALLPILSIPAWSELNPLPAARVHVRDVQGVPTRFTSKLAKVIEMNFTFGFDHSQSKPLLSGMLSRIAKDYAIEGQNAFQIQRFTGPGGGASNGLPNPSFTLDDLLSAEVIVTNNVSLLSNLPQKDYAGAVAFEAAVRQEGRGVLGLHASAEGNGKNWEFYANCLSPLEFESHSYSISVPVYKDDREARHVTLEDVLVSGTPAEVPMGLDENRQEVLKSGVITRTIWNEANHYARNPFTDGITGPLTTPLLRFDPRSTPPGDFQARYRFAGGNPYAFIVQAGRGKSGYISTGHDQADIQALRSFDAGTGDFERFFAQMLFYLAGYRQEPCGGAVDCSGLPVVDGSDHIVPSPTGIPRAYGRPEFFAAGRIGFAYSGPSTYRALLTDLRGKAVASRSGKGSAEIEFDTSGMRPGIYCLSVRIGSQALRAKRYSVPVIRKGAG